MGPLQAATAALLLSFVYSASGLVGSQFTNDITSFGARGSRAMAAPQDFPARLLHGFEGHHWKRQESDIVADTDLQTEESWYWGPSKTPPRHLMLHLVLTYE
jgi:hypothetical protein